MSTAIRSKATSASPYGRCHVAMRREARYQDDLGTPLWAWCGARGLSVEPGRPLRRRRISPVEGRRLVVTFVVDRPFIAWSLIRARHNYSHRKGGGVSVPALTRPVGPTQHRPPVSHYP